MKKLGLVISCLSLLFITCSQNPYAAEDEILERYYANFNDNGDSLKEIYTLLERDLITHNILPDTGAATYYYAIQYIINNDQAPFCPSLSLSYDMRYEQLEPFNSQKTINPNFLDATIGIANNYPNSKVTAIADKISTTKYPDSLSLHGMFSDINEQDLKHPLYRMMALALLLETNKATANVWYTDYKRDDKAIKLNKRSVLLFLVDSLGNISCNGSVIGIDEIKETTLRFLRKETSPAVWLEREISLLGTREVNTGWVTIIAHKNLPKQQLMPIYNEVNESYTIIRHESAKENFNKDYFYLSPKERQSIKMLTLKQISRSESNF